MSLLILSLICLIPITVYSKAEPDTLESVLSDSIASNMELDLAPAPATNVTVADTDNDAGGSITVSWMPSVDDSEDGKVKLYRVMRAEAVNGQPGEFTEVGDSPAGKADYSTDDGNTSDDGSYFYKVVAVSVAYNEAGDLLEFTAASDHAGPITSTPQWFHKQRINTLVGMCLLSFFIIYYIVQAKAGKKLFIRKIAGMEAVDEAVGRATEMGRKIFYISGIGDMDNMMTIAAMTILGRVAELSAQYETYLDVPVCRSMVMVTAREVIKEAHSKVGRPDAYKDDMVHYLTDDQFGYAAGVDGLFVREKPATIFFMGQFYAESLILAETRTTIGALKIAGTAMPSHVPFFIAACDYTLIGEELFAASAYLSREPKLLGSLKGQDVGKGVVLVAILVGVLLETFGVFQLSNLFSVID